jgi:hypothetical protein
MRFEYGNVAHFDVGRGAGRLRGRSLAIGEVLTMPVSVFAEHQRGHCEFGLKKGRHLGGTSLAFANEPQD